MLKKLLPREDRFFILFREIAALLVEATEVFYLLTKEIENKSEIHIRRIKDLEHKADEITHETVALLHKSLITPMDPDDIYKLITTLDDVMDFLDAAAQRISLYGITSSTKDMQVLAEICISCADRVKKTVERLNNLKNNKEILKLCIDINRLENEADHALRVAIAKLFQEEKDTRQLIKLKEIYELLEEVTDKCEDVANVVEGIVLEYS